MRHKKGTVPDWICWEKVVDSFEPSEKARIWRAGLQYVDHTDMAICLNFASSFGAIWDAMEEKEQQLLLRPIWRLGFSSVAFLPLNEWVKTTDFIDGRKWRALRYATLASQGNWCRCCGRMPPDVELHVDHIIPRSASPQDALDPNNLQVLCADCNRGKGSTDRTDWRRRERTTRSFPSISDLARHRTASDA